MVLKQLGLKEVDILIIKELMKINFFIRGRKNENARQYTYLGFTFASSGKKHVSPENLINKARIVWFLIKKMVSKSSEKTVAV